MLGVAWKWVSVERSKTKKNVEMVFRGRLKLAENWSQVAREGIRVQNSKRQKCIVLRKYICITLIIALEFIPPTSLVSFDIRIGSDVETSPRGDFQVTFLALKSITQIHPLAKVIRKCICITFILHLSSSTDNPEKFRSQRWFFWFWNVSFKRTSLSSPVNLLFFSYLWSISLRYFI